LESAVSGIPADEYPKGDIMELKTNVRINIKTRIKCPRCLEKFDKPVEEETSIQCPYCGTKLKLSTESIDRAMREAEAKAAVALKGARVPVPQEYAGNSKLKNFTAPLNIVGIASTIWTFFFPIPYNIVIVACALVPVASILLMWFFKGLIDFETKRRRSEEPSMTLALVGPPTALTWRALNDFHILAFDRLWIPAIVVSVIFSVLLYVFSADIKRKPAYVLVTLIFGLMYGFGVITEANCLPDKSMPRVYTATVLGKRISYGSRSRSYYIKVTPWGPRTERHEISLRRTAFERINVNDQLNMSVKDGVLGIPWFIMQRRT
jgi:DNA-directed RNA polymerase subunit RPC12/RpoP